MQKVTLILLDVQIINSSLLSFWMQLMGFAGSGQNPSCCDLFLQFKDHQQLIWTLQTTEYMTATHLDLQTTEYMTRNDFSISFRILSVVIREEGGK